MRDEQRLDLKCVWLGALEAFSRFSGAPLSLCWLGLAWPSSSRSGEVPPPQLQHSPVAQTHALQQCPTVCGASAEQVRAAERQRRPPRRLLRPLFDTATAQRERWRGRDGAGELHFATASLPAWRHCGEPSSEESTSRPDTRTRPEVRSEQTNGRP